MEAEVVAERVAPVIGGCFLLFFILVSLIITAVMAWAYCRIFAKAGYPWALGLLMLVPIANIVMPLVLAFGDWPIQRELRLLRQRQNKTDG
jgi:carbon starvation protein CstA